MNPTPHTPDTAVQDPASGGACATPTPDVAGDQRELRRRTVRSVRRALVPFSVAGPLLCAVLLLAVELTARASPSPRELAAQALTVLLVVAVNLLAGRRIGLRLVGAHTALADQASARAAAEQRLQSAVQELRDQQRQLTRRNADLDALAKATTAVLTGSDARQAICTAARDVSGALAVLLCELDATGARLTATRTAGLALPVLAVATDSTSRTASTYRTARTQLVPDLTADPGTDQDLVAMIRSVAGGQPLRAAVFVPVVTDGRSRAVLVVTLAQPLSLDASRTLGLLEMLAADAALALSREDLTAELAHHSLTDPLTGQANRRRWEGDLTREIDRAARTGSPLSVISLDLDHFKAYNDTHGHPAGDSLLRDATTAWARLLRTDDTLARVGGEEFAVLLPNCTGPDATQLARALLRAVPHGQTCSAGVTQWSGDTAEQLLARADTALYRAKNSGRARVELATSSPRSWQSHPTGRPLRALGT